MGRKSKHKVRTVPWNAPVHPTRPGDLTEAEYERLKADTRYTEEDSWKDYQVIHGLVYTLKRAGILKEKEVWSIAIVRYAHIACARARGLL